MIAFNSACPSSQEKFNAVMKWSMFVGRPGLVAWWGVAGSP